MTLEQQTASHKPSSPILVVLAWIVVAVPALWGISMSARTAMKLFRPEVVQTTTAPAKPPMPVRNP